MMLHRESALSRRLRALHERLEARDDDTLPDVLDLPPLTLPRSEQPSEEQEYDDVPEGYVLYLFPAKEPAPETAPGSKTTRTRTWLRTAFRQRAQVR